MKRFENDHVFQLREIGIALTFVGGFIDAYTFGQHGGVMAAGQTGNIIFLSVDIAQHNLPGTVTKLATMIFFILGIVTVEIIRLNIRKYSHYWRIISLAAELLVCLIIGLLPKSVPNLLIVPPLAFVMAMQTTAFGQIEGRGYNNVFSTGNLKKATIALTRFGLYKDRGQLTEGLVYFELVLGFTAGAVLSALIQSLLGLQTIWFATIFLIIISGYYGYLLRMRDQV